MKHWIISITAILLLASCEKELDFKYHDIPTIPVIEALLTQNEARVSLTNTTPMNEPLDTTRITTAEMSITDLQEGTLFNLMPDNEGYFTASIPTVYGNTYRLKVVSGGKQFESECLMYPAVEIKNLEFTWIKMPYDMVAVLTISFTELEDRDACYWTRIYKNGEPYKWALSHGSGAEDGVLKQSMFTTRENPDDEDSKSVLKEGDVLEVYVTPISLKMYDYLTAIQSDSNGESQFDGDFCLGYFLAAGEACDSITFYPRKID